MASAFVRVVETLRFILLIVGVVSADGRSSDPEDVVQLKDVVLVVLSQPHPYHARRAEMLSQHLEQQMNHPELVLTHRDWPDIQGAWTVFPLIPHFARMFSDRKWIVFCEEETRMDLPQLVSLLRQYDGTQDGFLGRGLRDQQATIIHHFAFIEEPSSFAYPDFGAGVVLSVPFIKRMAEKLSEGAYQKIQFAIDPKHELAKFIWDNLGERLTPVCELCGDNSSQPTDCECATWQPVSFPTDCGESVPQEDLFVAVKTCSKFHQDRVPVVKATWGKETKLIEYYSDVEDPSIPTVNLGVPNTERGHCGKTKAILRHVADSKRLESISWLLIADDDTIINLERLRQLLPCYSSEKPVFLGERYGYGVFSGYGYNYITGGGGMVFNRAAVELLAKEFNCPSDDSPDDMLLGMFFTGKDIPPIHSRHFHQARPDDYSKDFLNTQVPVSFHKHWNNDPYKVYRFLTSDKKPSESSPPLSTHEEL